MKIFRDEKHMKPDISLPKLIREGLEQSEYLIFLAEKAAAESSWCGQELEIWCGELQRTDRLLICLINDEIAIDGTNGIHWVETTALPALLRQHLSSVPLYLDLRWAKTSTDTDLQHPKYRHEINALASRLRGVNPEDLNDEEILVFRRNIRVRNGAIAVLLGMLLLAVGAAWWAVKQQKIAVLEKENAESTLKQLQFETAPETKIFEEVIKEWEIRNNYILKDNEWRTRLDTLDMSRKGLFTLPEQVCMCENLTTLILFWNELNADRKAINMKSPLAQGFCLVSRIPVGCADKPVSIPC